MNQSVTESLGQQVTKLTLNNRQFLWLDTWWVPVAVFLALGAGAWVLMSRTVVGRHLYAMGGNEEAARLSGIRTARLKWLAYVLGASTASIAGVFYAARAGSVDPVTMGLGYELNAIAAAVVGGCGLRGGVGMIPGIMLGVCFLRVVIHSVSKIIKGSPSEYEGLIVGVLIVLAVAFNELRGHRRVARQRVFPGALGVFSIFVLALLLGLVSQVLAADGFSSTYMGLYVGFGTLVVLGCLAWSER
jgi:ribose/xylose/arabinose/galactoside ABC-type transport system permease subunit